MSLLIRFFCMEQTKTQSNFVRNIPQFQLIFCFSRTNFFRVFLSVPMLLFLGNFFLLLLLKSQHTSQAEAKWKLNANSLATKAQSIFPIEPPKKRRKKKSQERTSHQNKERNAHITIQLSKKLSVSIWVTKDRDQNGSSAAISNLQRRPCPSSPISHKTQQLAERRQANMKACQSPGQHPQRKAQCGTWNSEPVKTPTFF